MTMRCLPILVALLISGCATQLQTGIVVERHYSEPKTIAAHLEPCPFKFCGNYGRWIHIGRFHQVPESVAPERWWIVVENSGSRLSINTGPNWNGFNIGDRWNRN